LTPPSHLISSHLISRVHFIFVSFHFIAARGIIENADLLVLDEPTNHLDIEGISYLKNVLDKRTLGDTAVLCVTHDRDFLDTLADEVMELEMGELYRYKFQGGRSDSVGGGAFGYYLNEKATRIELDAKVLRSLKNKLRGELEWIRRQPQARETKQRAREKDFEKLNGEVGRRREVQGSRGKVEFKRGEGRRLGSDVVELKGLTAKIGERVLIDDLSYTFGKNDRVAIVGKNGEGKSTLLRCITGEADFEGVIKKGETVKIGMFDQRGLQIQEGDEDMTLFEFVKREVENGAGGGEAGRTPLNLLKDLNFEKARFQTPISRLSGGERRRLQFLQVIATNPNVLLLDEPSNDLDITTMGVVEDLIENFEGVVVVVSHDVYFLSKSVSTIFAFEGGGVVKCFEGNIGEYMAKRELEAEAGKRGGGKKDKKHKKDKKDAKEAVGGGDAKEVKKANTMKERINMERERKKLDERMTKMGKEIETASSKYEKAANEGMGWSELAELEKGVNALKEKLGEVEERWMEIEEALEVL